MSHAFDGMDELRLLVLDPGVVVVLVQNIISCGLKLLLISTSDSAKSSPLVDVSESDVTKEGRC